jgi:hypothetical protein
MPAMSESANILPEITVSESKTAIVECRFRLQENWVEK